MENEGTWVIDTNKQYFWRENMVSNKQGIITLYIMIYVYMYNVYVQT